MKTVELNASVRKELGTKFAKAGRREGNVPAEVYGGKENQHITVDEVAFTKLINTPEVFFIDLTIDGNHVKSLIKDVDFHPVSDRVTHVDFLEVNEDKVVRVKIPVVLKGQARGVLNGGRLRHIMKKLEVQGLPSALPEAIEVDIAKLRIGQSISVGDLSIDGIELLAPETNIIVGVKTARVIVEEEEEEVEGEEGAEGEGGEAGEGGDAKPSEGGDDKPAEGGDASE